MIDKNELEDLYRNNTNVICCHKLQITQTTLLKWLDKYGIQKKGSPQQQRGIGHKEILSNWWRSGGQWARVERYNGQYYILDQWVDCRFFYNLKSAKMPKELK